LNARKINVESYPFTIQMMVDGNITEVPKIYDVKNSIERVVLANDPRQTARLLAMNEAMKLDKIMDEIRAADGHAVISEPDYQLIKQRFDEFRGIGVYDVELCRRIAEAETVQVEEKK